MHDKHPPPTPDLAARLRRLREHARAQDAAFIAALTPDERRRYGALEAEARKPIPAAVINRIVRSRRSSARASSRARGAGRPAARRPTAARRSTGRGGDLGEDGPSEPPLVAVRIAGAPSPESDVAVARYLMRFLAGERPGTTWTAR